MPFLSDTVILLTSAHLPSETITIRIKIFNEDKRF